MKYLCIALMLISGSAFSQQNQDWLSPFSDIYQKELGSVQACQQNQNNVFRVCSDALRNDGNAPYILHSGKPQKKVMVLFHGLSDSPFFFSSIAPFIKQQGFTVVVGLLPGHGKKQADADMEDSELYQRWQDHVSEVISYASTLGERVYLGGFSTGGALVTHYVLEHPGEVDGLLLFSGALALDESVESMAGIWGMGWLTKFLDGDYQTDGPNPHKYPGVSKYAAMVLVDVIKSIRTKMAENAPMNLPVFAAHSMSDTTTLWHGVEQLMAYNKGPNTPFIIEKELDVCHADVVINEPQLKAMEYDLARGNPEEKCSVPQANPKHAMMMQEMVTFLRNY